jgi:hypothetical protein
MPPAFKGTGVARSLRLCVIHSASSENCNVKTASNNGWRKAKDVIPPELYERAQDNTWDAILLATDRNAVLTPTLSRSCPFAVCLAFALTRVDGDSHPGNFYQIKDTGKMGFTDFQMLCRSHPARDVAYMLSSCLLPEDRRGWEKELFQHYFDEFAKDGAPPLDQEQFMLEWRVQLWTSLASWTLTYAPSPQMPEMQPDVVCREVIRRIASALHDHDAFGALDQIRDE